VRVSQVEAALSSEDILSIIRDFVKIEGLNIDEINIGNEIEIKGTFKKFITIAFNLKAKLEKVESNNLYLKVKSIKLFKLGLLKPIKKLGMKMVLKEFKEQGIEVNGEDIIIKVNTILKSIPFISLDIKALSIEAGIIKVRVENIDFSLTKFKGEGVEAKVEELKTEDEKEDDYIESLQVERIKDVYSEGRMIVQRKIPEKLKEYEDYLFLVPDMIAFIYRLLKDKRVPLKTKVALGISLGYVTFPFDILPDNIPFIGSVDDLAVIFFALNRIINDVPVEVILENWQGKNHFIVVLKHTVNYLSKFTAAKNIDKIYSFIDEMVVSTPGAKEVNYG
jgi:uncharacterized membrane protein YkvA (DUF1232 family)